MNMMDIKINDSLDMIKIIMKKCGVSFTEKKIDNKVILRTHDKYKYPFSYTNFTRICKEWIFDNNNKLTMCKKVIY